MKPVILRNGTPVSISSLALLPFEDWKAGILSEVDQAARVTAFFLEPGHAENRLHAILAHGNSGELHWWVTEAGPEYASLTPDCPQVHWFEREIAEQWAVRPAGHPWLKPLRYHRSYRQGEDAWCRPRLVEIVPGVADFFHLKGEEVHEVAVGPVHAGVIEPGHFRFQCHGETVFHLEVSLGYQHRGIERSLAGGPGLRTIHHMETLAGDTTVGHSIAYCEALEALAGCQVSPAAQQVRAIALELERLANHTGDLGALANDVGYLPTASFCGRIRGDLLNTTALLCGNRFGRRLVRPGGLGVPIGKPVMNEVKSRVETALVDIRNAVELLWKTPSVRARFENAGRLSSEICVELGLVGVAARASGLARDVREEFPTGAYTANRVAASTHRDGNVQARAWVRWEEIQRSVEFICREVDKAEWPVEPTLFRAPGGPLKPEAAVATLVEGWRGEICHVTITDRTGRFQVYKVVDPSFHNWMGLAIALRHQQISDFPLCNKSFNLSYCGHDL